MNNISASGMKDGVGSDAISMTAAPLCQLSKVVTNKVIAGGIVD